MEENLFGERTSLQEFRENARAVFEEQLIVRRGGSDHDVTAFFSLWAKVAAENVIYRIHVLGTAAEGQDRRIRLRWIISVRKNDFVLDRDTTHLLGLLEQLRLGGQDCEHRDNHRRGK